MTNPAHFRKLEEMYASAPCNTHYTVRVSQGQAEVSVTVQPEFLHAGGVVHGSIYFKLLDDAATFAANSLVEDFALLTANFNIHFLRPVDSGLLTATANVVNQSRRIILAEAQVSDSAGRQLARGSGTFMRSNISLLKP